jgi:hypothetical protein
MGVVMAELRAGITDGARTPDVMTDGAAAAVDH